MTIDSLLEGWARWCARRDDSGLGYAASALNRLISGEVCSGRVAPGALPYGIDPDSVFSRVDSAVLDLPDLHRLIIVRHFLRIGTDKAKAKATGCCVRTYYKYLADAKTMLAKGLSGILVQAA